MNRAEPGVGYKDAQIIRRALVLGLDALEAGARRKR
jgi:hypothetical protein